VLGDLVAAAGDDAEVEVLMPIGVDPTTSSHRPSRSGASPPPTWSFNGLTEERLAAAIDGAVGSGVTIRRYSGGRSPLVRGRPGGSLDPTCA
jgi:hypothetical protein